MFGLVLEPRRRGGGEEEEEEAMVEGKVTL